MIKEIGILMKYVSKMSGIDIMSLKRMLKRFSNLHVYVNARCSVVEWLESGVIQDVGDIMKRKICERFSLTVLYAVNTIENLFVVGLHLLRITPL